MHNKQRLCDEALDKLEAIKRHADDARVIRAYILHVEHMLTMEKKHNAERIQQANNHHVECMQRAYAADAARDDALEDNDRLRAELKGEAVTA